jgi:hypothetical protein
MTKITIFDQKSNMYATLKIITLVFILFAKMALGYYNIDLEQSKSAAGFYSTSHSDTVQHIVGPFVFENESRSESEDDNDDDALDCTIASYQNLQQEYHISPCYTDQKKNPVNDDRLFILYGNFRL